MTCPEERPRSATPAIFIDALNLAYWCDAPPSLRMPMALMTHLLTTGHPTRMYFDASARYRLAGEAEWYLQLLPYSEAIIEVPSGRAADGVMLKQARSSEACIVSRDHYRDHRKRYRKLIDDPARLISGWVREGRLQLPALTLDLALPTTVEEAWQALKPVLEHGARVASDGVATLGVS